MPCFGWLSTRSLLYVRIPARYGLVRRFLACMMALSGVHHWYSKHEFRNIPTYNGYTWRIRVPGVDRGLRAELGMGLFRCSDRNKLGVLERFRRGEGWWRGWYLFFPNVFAMGVDSSMCRIPRAVLRLSNGQLDSAVISTHVRVFQRKHRCDAISG